MQIVLNDFGLFLGKKGNRFIIKNKGTKKEFVMDKVDQIVIAAGSSISISAIKYALQKNIDIVFLSNYGKPLGRIFPCKLGGTTLTRKKQLEAYYTNKGVDIAKKLIGAKIANQGYLLRSLSKTRDIDFKPVANELIILSKKVMCNIKGDIETIRENILGLEGLAASKYFSCLSKILPFDNRDKKSNDQVNILLNYSYGILYNEIEKVCILAGLDPYFGFLHKDRYNKPSMVLDLIEEFRPVLVDKVIITLFVQKQIKEDFFEIDQETKQLILTKKGRDKIISVIIDRLDNKVHFKNKRLSFKDILLSQARDIANSFLDESKEFEPFVYKW